MASLLLTLQRQKENGKQATCKLRAHTMSLACMLNHSLTSNLMIMLFHFHFSWPYTKPLLHASVIQSIRIFLILCLKNQLWLFSLPFILIWNLQSNSMAGQCQYICALPWQQPLQTSVSAAVHTYSRRKYSRLLVSMEDPFQGLTTHPSHYLRLGF